MSQEIVEFASYLFILEVKNLYKRVCFKYSKVRFLKYTFQNPIHYHVVKFIV